MTKIIAVGIISGVRKTITIYGEDMTSEIRYPKVLKVEGVNRRWFNSEVGTTSCVFEVQNDTMLKAYLTVTNPYFFDEKIGITVEGDIGKIDPGPYIA